jgi:hypothetical protein
VEAARSCSRTGWLADDATGSSAPYARHDRPPSRVTARRTGPRQSIAPLPEGIAQEEREGLMPTPTRAERKCTGPNCQPCDDGRGQRLADLRCESRVLEPQPAVSAHIANGSSNRLGSVFMQGHCTTGSKRDAEPPRSLERGQVAKTPQDATRLGSRAKTSCSGLPQFRQALAGAGVAVLFEALAVECRDRLATPM